MGQAFGLKMLKKKHLLAYKRFDKNAIMNVINKDHYMQ